MRLTRYFHKSLDDVIVKTSESKSFFYSRYFSEGLRIASGVAIPALAGSFSGHLETGLVVTLGALVTGTTDNPGPRRHRLNGLLGMIFLLIPVSLITQLLLFSSVLTGIWIIVAGFLFSMLSVYQQRVASIGISCLIILVLCMHAPHSFRESLIYSGWLATGGIWYLLWSVLWRRLRPYRLMQQLTAEYTAGVGEYMETRAHFYESEPQYDETYRELLREQVTLRTQREALQEVLFSEYTIQKQPPVILRNLYKFYFDLNVTASHISSAFADYKKLHERFDHTGFLDRINAVLRGLAEELKEMAFAISAGLISRPKPSAYAAALKLHEEFELLRKTNLTSENVEDFISLGKIVDNLNTISGYVEKLHYYTNHDEKIAASEAEGIHANHETVRSRVNPELFLNNLNFASDIFRHALRVAVSMGIGFAIALIFNISFGYWILLTLVVILKPGYALTRQRNIDRLAGTFAGLVISAGILFLQPAGVVLVALIILMMIIAFSFFRRHYLISMVFTTVYLILFFQLSEPELVRKSLSSRMIDTAIGSGIALIGFLAFPTWAGRNIHVTLAEFAGNLRRQILLMSDIFSGAKPADRKETRVSSRKMLTSLANASDLFNRMLSEPKVFRGEIDSVYRFVVTAQLASSHSSALLQYSRLTPLFISPEILPDAQQAARHLVNVEVLLTGTGEAVETRISDEEGEADRLLKLRRIELSEGKLDTDTREQLVTAKAVTDQFAHLCALSGDLESVAKDFRRIG